MKNNKKSKYDLFLILLFGMILFIQFQSFFMITTRSSKDISNPKSSQLVELPYVIRIENNWSETVATYSWASGSGTEEDPYVIENVSINSGDRGACIQIIDSSEYFVIRNNNLSGVIALYGHDIFAGIYIEKSEFGIIENNTLYHNYHGIVVLEAEEIIIRDNDIIGSHTENFTGMGCAVLIDEAKQVNITDNRIINHYNGVVIYDAEDCFVDYNHIENLLFGHTSDTGVYFDNVTGGSITYNDFYGCNATTQGSTGLSTAGFGSNPIMLQNCIDILVFGNIFHGIDNNTVINYDKLLFGILFFGVFSVVLVLVVIIVSKKHKKEIIENEKRL